MQRRRREEMQGIMGECNVSRNEKTDIAKCMKKKNTG